MLPIFASIFCLSSAFRSFFEDNQHVHILKLILMAIKAYENPTAKKINKTKEDIRNYIFKRKQIFFLPEDIEENILYPLMNISRVLEGIAFENPLIKQIIGIQMKKDRSCNNCKTQELEIQYSMVHSLDGKVNKMVRGNEEIFLQTIIDQYERYPEKGACNYCNSKNCAIRDVIFPHEVIIFHTFQYKKNIYWNESININLTQYNLIGINRHIPGHFYGNFKEPYTGNWYHFNSLPNDYPLLSPITSSTVNLQHDTEQCSNSHYFNIINNDLTEENITNIEGIHSNAAYVYYLREQNNEDDDIHLPNISPRRKKRVLNKIHDFDDDSNGFLSNSDDSDTLNKDHKWNISNFELNEAVGDENTHQSSNDDEYEYSSDDDSSLNGFVVPDTEEI